MRTPLKSTLAVSVCAGALWLGLCASQAAVVENLTYDLGSVQFVIPRLESTGGTLTDADLRAIFDPRSPDTMSQRLGKLNAASIVAPQAIFEIKAGPVANKVIYRDLKLTNVGNGMIESATVGGASGDMKDPNGGDIKVTYGPMSTQKINLALMLRVFSARRTDANEPLATIYESFTADGFQMTSRDADISMGRMTGAGVKMRALASPISEIVEMAQLAGAPRSRATPQQQQKVFSMVSDIFQSFEFGQVEARDMKVIVKKEPGEIGIGRIFMSGFAKGRIGEVAYENFVMNMPDGAVKLGRVGLRDFDLQRTFAAMADAAQRGDTEFKNTNPRNLIPTLGQFQIAGLDLNVPDKKGAGNSEDGQRILFSLKNFEINASKYIEGIPTALAVTLQNFAFPIPKKPMDVRLNDIAAFGIEKIDLSHNMDIAWNEGAKEIGIKDYSFNLAGLGAMKLSGVIGNVTKDLFSNNLALVQAAAFSALIKSAEVNVDNQGVVEKGFAMQAKQSGQTPQQVQQMLVAGAAMGIPALLGNGAGAKALAGALSKFAAEPKKLRIAARAKDGLGASDMMLLGNPSALLEKLEITATAD